MIPKRMPSAACAALGAIVLAAAAGCGRSTGSIEGMVTYRGEPVPNGMVAVFASTGRVVTGRIIAGRFAARDVPVGEAVVTVECDKPPAKPPKPPPDENILPTDRGFAEMPELTAPPAAAGVAIPTRYATRATSPLRIKLVGGSQRFDITLEE